MDDVRVAVVGSGPAACYAAAALLQSSPDLTITMFDRLPTPFGLVRAGVAPDHQQTKRIAETFAGTLSSPRLQLQLGVDVGVDVPLAELRRRHHAIVFATGAPDSRRLGIPGEELLGSHTVSEFVAWYNGHPDFADLEFDLSTPTTVIVGNGNVALDAARILLTPTTDLERTDIAHHALDRLRTSRVRKVVLLGRRGPAQAAFSNSEFLGVADSPSIKVGLDVEYPGIADETHHLAWASGTPEDRYKLDLLRRTTVGARSARELVLEFLATPVEIVGAERVSALRIRRNQLERTDEGAIAAVGSGELQTIDAGLVLSSVGHRGRPIEGVPFDSGRGIIPNVGGRVTDENGVQQVGLYATGWVKRGPSGVIGTNRTCAEETVRALLDDLDSGELKRLHLRPAAPRGIDFAGWGRIDVAERDAGEALGKTREKLVRRDELTRAAAMAD